MSVPVQDLDVTTRAQAGLTYLTYALMRLPPGPAA
jgi:hypothetical protein